MDSLKNTLRIWKYGEAEEKCRFMVFAFPYLCVKMSYHRIIKGFKKKDLLLPSICNLQLFYSCSGKFITTL